MKYFDLVQSFIEQSTTVGGDGELRNIFRRTIEALGFRYFACWSHVDPLQPPRLAVVMYTYPQAWVQEFSERQWFQVDPVLRYSEKTLVPFFWDSAEFRGGLTVQQQAIMTASEDFGIAHGYTIPIHSPNSLGGFQASCSVIPDGPSLELARYQVVQLMAYHMYSAATREAESKEATLAPVELSARERQCLELVARGKSDWVVGKLLGISESTVHNHIERAKRRLGVSTRVQAIVYALAARQISFGDVIKAEPSDRGALSDRDSRA